MIYLKVVNINNEMLSLLVHGVYPDYFIMNTLTHSTPTTYSDHILHTSTLSITVSLLFNFFKERNLLKK